MSVHKHIKRQKNINQTQTKGKSPKHWPREDLLTGYSGYAGSSIGFAESLIRLSNLKS